MQQKKGRANIKVPRFKESAGFYTTSERSRIMSKIRGKDTKPEILLRKALYNKGFRYRLNVKSLPGKPDIANKSLKLAIFIDGEFWHGYDWKNKKRQIKSNREFWIPKIERNIERDKETNSKLEAMGYTVLRFWDKQILQNLESCVNQIFDCIRVRKLSVNTNPSNPQ